MCLAKICPDMNRFEKGWKSFRVYKGKLYTLFQGKKNIPLPENKWIHYKRWSAITGKIPSIYDGFYPQGWHVEATQKGAKNWQGVIRRVLCRDMHTTGRQWGRKVGVCRYIKILPESVDA